MKLLKIPFHPVLFATFPLFSLFAHNCAYVRDRELFLPLILAWSVAAVVLAILQLILRSAAKSALAASIFLLIFFSYDYLFGLMWHQRWGTFAFNKHENMGMVLAVLFAALVVIVRNIKSNFSSATAILNVIGIALVFLPAAEIAGYNWNNRPVGQTVRTVKSVHSRPAAARLGAVYPDIYYLVPDRYGSAETLLRDYGFDNSVFLGQLRKRGFYVASRSTVNYPKTAYSLVSTLSMDYIDGLTEQWGRTTNNWKPLYSLVQDFPVWHILRERGYTFVNCGSWWEPTRKNPHADVNINYKSIPNS